MFHLRFGITNAWHGFHQSFSSNVTMGIHTIMTSYKEWFSGSHCWALRGDSLSSQRSSDFIQCVNIQPHALQGGAHKVHPTPTPSPSLWDHWHVYWHQMNSRCKFQLPSQTIYHLTPVTVKGGFTNYTFLMIFTGWFCRGLLGSKSLLPITLTSSNIPGDTLSLRAHLAKSNPEARGFPVSCSPPFYPLVIRFLISNQRCWIHPTWNYAHYRLPITAKVKTPALVSRGAEQCGISKLRSSVFT